MADKKDPRIQDAFVMKGGKKIPIKMRHVSMDEYSRRQSAIAAEEDAAAVMAEHAKAEEAAQKKAK